MNPFVKKEIRLLLPNAVICCTLGLANFLFTFNNDGSLQYLLGFLPSFVICGAMAVMLALNSFGSEISSGTFSNLLVQPISRQNIWETKILVLAASLLAVGIFWSACGIIRLKMIGHALNLPDLFTGVGTFGLVVFSGGLWTVLLLRQIAAAFWFTVLVPTAIWVILLGLFAGQSDEFAVGIVVSMLGVYSIAGLFFARWLFFRAQDLQWSGGAVVLPEMRGLARRKSLVNVGRAWRPRAALWQKEIQLHQSQLIIAFTLLVLHLGVLVTRKLGHFHQNSTIEIILETFWVLWLVIPYLVGCAAAAEERKLGTHEVQFCLPVKRRTEFTVKLSVVLLLSFLFGVAMPLLLEGTRVLPDAHLKLFNAFSAQLEMSGIPLQALKQGFFWNCLVQINYFMPFLTLAGMTAGIGVLSFYVSTLARNTFQALGPAVLGLILFAFLMAIAQTQESAGHPIWHGELIYLIGLPVTLVTLLALAFWNFRHLATSWQLWLRNLLTLAASLALVVVATAAIYHRAWEILTPFEPAHGAARLALKNPANLNDHWNDLSARLPDGRIWMAHFIPSPFSSSPVAFALGNIAVSVGSGSYLEGSNWITVRRFQQELVGIKTDGTLWVSEKPWRAQRSRPGDWQQNDEEMRHLVQFGNETNWTSLQPANGSVLLVKEDGTLWRWGRRDFDIRHKQWPGLRSFTPYQLGTESNWAGLFESGYQTYLRKIDGSVWALDYYLWDTKGTTLEINKELTVQAVTGSSHNQFRSIATITYGPGHQVGIRDDGTFRIWADQHYDPRPRRGMVWSATDSPIGHETNWLAVAGSVEKMVTLKNDGSLWLWDFSWNARYVWVPEAGKFWIQNVIPIRLGTHSDWISITSAQSGIIGLAADGSLWFWPLARPRYYSNTGWQFEPLLDMPRKPVCLGNIFTAR